jgi:hypothetical protein
MKRRVKAVNLKAAKWLVGLANESRTAMGPILLGQKGLNGFTTVLSAQATLDLPQMLPLGCKLFGEVSAAVTGFRKGLAFRKAGCVPAARFRRSFVPRINWPGFPPHCEQKENL